MIQLKKRPVAVAVALLASLSILASYFAFSGMLAFGIPDASLGPLSPNLTSSYPTGAHTFLMRKNNLGKNDQLQIKAYYPVDTNWDQQYIYIDPYLECQVDFDSDNNAGGPVTYMTVVISTNSAIDTYNIKIDKQTGLNNVCTVTGGRVNDEGDNGNNKNKLFARYPLPGSNRPDVDTPTQLLAVTVEIVYNNSIVTEPTKSDAHNNSQRFQVRAQSGPPGGSYTDNNAALVGPTGGNDGGISNNKLNFPVMGRPEHYGSPTQISVPFGLPCNTNTSQIKRVGIYDADKFPGPDVKFKVKDMGDGDSGPTDNVPFDGGLNPKPYTPTIGNFSRDWFTPSQDNGDKSSVAITMEPDHRYQLQVVGLDGGNTIVINVPTETIYGVIGCGWRMRPDSSVVPGVQQPDGWVTFTHTATNVGAFNSDPVTSKVKWGKDWGVKTTGTVSTHPNQVYNPHNSTVDRTFTETFQIPANAQNNWLYCQYLEVNPHSKRDSNAYDSWIKGDRACVRVDRPGIPPETVGITPVVNGNMDYIEPTETATFDGYVNVTNFPQFWDDEWGYTEVARQRPATRVTATASASSLQQDGPHYTSRIATTTTTTTYTCPHPNDTKISNSTCRHARPYQTTRAGCEAAGYTWSNGSCKSYHNTTAHTSTSTSYSCPATYVVSGSQCKRVRYKCPSSSTWGSWNASPPSSCPSYWTCPGGAAGSGYSYTAPNCQGWKCQYAPYTQVNRATAPPCEYRCTDGTGDDRAPQSNGWTGDMNCYQQPSFTLTCYWKNKPQFSQTVTHDGQYCSNRDFDANEAGVTIGTPVRAVLTANYPGDGAWSSPPPGYRVNTLAVLWGWSNNPFRSDEDTVRVVGKPTVKLYGGDISAGGGFISNGVCNPAASAMIAGWPHTPNYNAAGTQFGAFSSSTVTGFSSAMINTNSAHAPRSLVFANYPTSGGDTFGGSFDNDMPCASDHYGASPSGLSDIGLSSINSNPTTPTPSGSYRGSGGQIDHNPVIRNGQRITVYATGNVYISGSGIRYNRTGWISTQDIPAFKLVVYGGNIYIDPSVTELSGIYVAQPNGNVGGNIYTCANNGSLIANSSLYGSCQNLLTVNGVFIAKKVHLQRTQGTAIRGETAERFNYLPEVWLAPWPQTNSASEIKYDAIISLPPVL